MELDPVLPETKPLNSGFVSDQCDNNVTRLGCGLGAHNHKVTGQDACADHTVPVDAEGEELAATTRLGGLVGSTQSIAFMCGAGMWWSGAAFLW